MNYKTATIQELVEEFIEKNYLLCYEEIFKRVLDYVNLYNSVYKIYNDCKYYRVPDGITTFELQVEGQEVRGFHYKDGNHKCVFAFPYRRVEMTTQQIAAELIEKEEAFIKELTTTIEKRKTLLEEFKKKEFQ